MSLVDWLKRCLSALLSAPLPVWPTQRSHILSLTLTLTCVAGLSEGCERGAHARGAPAVNRAVAAPEPPPQPITLNSQALEDPAAASASERELIVSADVIPGDAMITRLAVRAQGARWSEQHTLRVGPIPDYAPVRAVYFHRQLAGLAPESALSLEVLLSGLYEVDDYDPGELEGDTVIEDTMLLWMRDYHPIYVREPTGALRAIHYLAHNPNRARYLLRGAPRVDELDHLPLIHENGNLIVAGQWVFVSERLLEDNQDGENEDHLIEGGYLPRGKSELIAMLSERLHIPRDHVVMLPNMPHEATGHVDLYLMALNDHQVIIPKVVIPIEHFSQHPLERQIAEDVKRFLDERAQQLARLGLEVIRLPQLPPLWLPALDEPEGNYDVVFYTPTNGLLVNKGTEQLALLPHFEAEALRPELKEMSEAYEKYWRQVFTALGWPAYMVNTTHLGRYLGLIHCVTATTPLLPLRDEWRSRKRLPPARVAQRAVQTRAAEVSAARATIPVTQGSYLMTRSPDGQASTSPSHAARRLTAP